MEKPPKDLTIFSLDKRRNQVKIDLVFEARAVFRHRVFASQIARYPERQAAPNTLNDRKTIIQIPSRDSNIQSLFQRSKNILVLFAKIAHIKCVHEIFGLITFLVNLISPPEKVVQFLVPVVAFQRLGDVFQLQKTANAIQITQ